MTRLFNGETRFYPINEAGKIEANYKTFRRTYKGKPWWSWIWQWFHGHNIESTAMKGKKDKFEIIILNIFVHQTTLSREWKDYLEQEKILTNHKIDVNLVSRICTLKIEKQTIK